MKRILIIYNQKSGKKSDALAEQVKQQLISKGVQAENISIVIPNSIEKAVLETKKACKNQIDIIIPLGGDGTLNKIIGAVYETGSHTKVGIIPSGTVNNFATALQIPTNIEMAVNVILNGKTQLIDICKVNKNYMISSLTLGLLADIAAGVISDAKRKWGFLAFLRDSFKILKKNRSYDVILETKSQSKVFSLKFLLVTMTNSIAGFQNFSPNASVDDGFFEIYTLKKIHFVKFLKHINEFRQGDYSAVEEIEHFRTNTLTISPAHKGKLAFPRTRIDGDKSDLIPVKLELVPKAVAVFIP